MDGELAPLPELSRAARDADAWLVVDDAHGLGVVGASGRGALEHFGLDAGEVPVLIGTLGKAFGSFGAFVAGGADLIELLIQKARPYIYTTALPQPVAAATRCALELIQTESWRRERLLCLTARFRRQAREAGVPLADSPTPIQPVLFGSAAAALAAQRELEEAGFWVVAIRPPTVPAETGTWVRARGRRGGGGGTCRCGRTPAATPSSAGRWAASSLSISRPPCPQR